MRDFQLFIDFIKSGPDEEIENKFQIEFLEMEDHKSWRILHYACFYGRVKLVNFLLSKKCKLDKQTRDGCQPIHLASDNGHIDIVKILIDNKCDINASDKKGYQSIHWACWRGHIDIVKILTANKCEIDSFDNIGYQPIHWACKNGHIDIVKILITCNCDINTFNYEEYQPIHLAFINGHIDIVKILIDNKCDINAYDKEGYQAIHWACWNDHFDIVNILIENKCDINVYDKKGHQPIHLACQNGHIDIVKILIDNKCDINASNKGGYQPIHLACMNNHIDVVNILIDNKCDINASDKIKGYQPIHLACMNNHIDVVKILIDNNCETQKLSRKEESPIGIAENREYQQIINILKTAELEMKIAKEMDLNCTVECDHRFCRKSLGKEIFRKDEVIGSGTFGKVYKYKISNTNREIVIKRTKFICEDSKNIEGNINKYSSRIIHGNIVRYFGALRKKEDLHIYMEYIPGGTLKNLIDKSEWIETTKVIKFSKQILEGLQFLHSQNIIHRDIKPDNMLLDTDETLKLTDFGLSKSLCIESISKKTKQAETFCGTPWYMAPEVYLEKLYEYPADIWSTGASIIHMITGKKPFDSYGSGQALFKIGNTNKMEFTPCQPISETMRSFIDDLLTPEQTKRPNAESLLKHEIFKNSE